MAERKLIGIELTEKSAELTGKDLVGKAKVEHVGKYVSAELSGKVTIEFVPIAHKVIDTSVDWLERQIPGDQKALADAGKAVLKNFVSAIKIKF